MSQLSPSSIKDIEHVNIIAWIIANDIKTERGVPFDFDRFSFMIDPYLDWTPLQGTRKCSQIGWSVMTNLKLFYAAKYGIPGYGIPAANVIYTMPTDNDIKAFVPSKTNALISNNKVLQDYFKDESGNKVDANSIERKKIGNSFVYFKGTRSQTAAIALTSDLNIHDEADRSDKNIIGMYESRLGTSLYKGRWIFSNPSAPNMPADLMYQISDQKHWFVKCEHCGHWQYLDWKKLSEHEFIKSNYCFVDDKNAMYVCSGCGLELTDDNRKRGKWVKKFSDKDVSGYWVTHMMCNWISVKEMLITEQTKDKAYFNNFALGLPYVGSDVVVDGQTIVNNIVLDEIRFTPGRVAMGVDNGNDKHYVIGDERGIWEIGKTQSWEHIEMLINKYKPYTVIDLNPYPNKPKELAMKYRNVWCSFYINDEKNLELVEWGNRDKAHMVYPHRNKIIDDLINYIFDGKIKFFKPRSYWEEYISHWETMYREDEQNSLGIIRGLWKTSTGKDHYCHATVYFYAALSKMIGAGGKVLNTKGDVIAQVAHELGGIPTSPSAGSQPNTIQAGTMMNPLNLIKKKKGASGAISGKM